MIVHCWVSLILATGIRPTEEVIPITRAQKRLCLICQNPFLADPRVGRRQRVCSKEACQKARKRRTWRRLAKGWRNKRRITLWEWAQGKATYWKDWRKKPDHCSYREREIKRMRRKRARLARVAKPTQRQRLYIERLQGLKAGLGTRGSVAKPTQIARRLDSLVECLIWNVRRKANPDGNRAGLRRIIVRDNCYADH